MESNAELQRFAGVFDAAIAAGDVWSCRDALVELSTGPLLARYVNERLEALRDGRAQEMRRGSETTLLLSRTRYHTLTVTPHAPGPFPRTPQLVESATNTLSAVACGSIRYTAYRQPHPEPHDVFDRTRRLERIGSAVLRRGDVLAMRAGSDVMDVEHVDERAAIVNLKQATVNTLIWSYDRQTLLPSGFTVARRRDSRIEFATKLLGLLGDAESADALEVLLEHDAHFIRWNAARALVRLDGGRGIEALERLLDDPHPDVRGAARRALDALAPQLTVA